MRTFLINLSFISSLVNISRFIFLIPIVRGKNMSIFLCICKGEYDALLQWPFSHRITFTLVDQSLDPGSRRNVSYSIKPNTCKENKPFLGRPLGERNASFGAQKFCELDILNTRDYIRDDTIYIKVDVDSDEMVRQIFYSPNFFYQIFQFFFKFFIFFKLRGSFKKK